MLQMANQGHMRMLRMRTSFRILLFAHDLLIMSTSKAGVQQELDALSLMASLQNT